MRMRLAQEPETALPRNGGRLIDKPVIIVGASRSGTTILFQSLSTHPQLWSLYRESQQVLGICFHPRQRDSSVLTEDDLDDHSRLRLEREFFGRAGNLERLPLGRLVPLKARGRLSRWIALLSQPYKVAPLRMVEKTPVNSLRIPFLKELFPDAQFLYLTRDPRSNIASIYKGWLEPRKYKTYPLPAGFKIVGYGGSHWSFGQPSGWRSYDGRTLMEICAFQWKSYNDGCLRDLAALNPKEVLQIRYEDLVARPAAVLKIVAGWAGVDDAPFTRFAGGLPVVNTRTRPDPHKWQALKSEIDQVLPVVADVAKSLGYM